MISFQYYPGFYPGYFFCLFFYYSVFHTYILFLWINKDDLSMKNKLFGGNDNES